MFAIVFFYYEKYPQKLLKSKCLVENVEGRKVSCTSKTTTRDLAKATILLNFAPSRKERVFADGWSFEKGRIVKTSFIEINIIIKLNMI